ncbi:unnamed protein product [Macrosiphum euphorbiae]|uniref:DUF5641 domain-containing protein n=1 Tax=Macrosiphum euphorbiae TaxID=13131 RepID=A0AAV0VU89_9HEMI|nr:unnamed protein product [Macrosiphum euphorbiae]
MSSDPNDFQALKAGHFLTMAPLISVPAPNLPVELGRISKSKRWSLIQQIHQHFWIRWQKEYILSLQERSKETRFNRNLQVGDLVLVNEPSSPLTWPTARVVEVHPGADGIVRVAKVKLSREKIYTQPSVKLCSLPLSD